MNLKDGDYNSYGGIVGKYYPLGEFLRQSPNSKETLTFQQIASIINDKLPPSASRHTRWWMNNPKMHPQAKEWLNAGWKVENYILGKEVTFIKIL